MRTAILFILIYGAFSVGVIHAFLKVSKKIPQANDQDNQMMIMGLVFLLLLAGVALYFLVLIGAGEKIKKPMKSLSSKSARYIG